MFEKIEVLEQTKHQDLRLDKINSFNFAKNITRVKLSYSEMRQASNWYPVVFMEDAPGIPQALFSLDGKTNLFVDDNGQWKVPYIPFFFRMYPFTLVAVDEKKEQFTLCLDPEADHFKSNMGDPLFTADGKPVEFIEKTVVKSLEKYQEELRVTQNLFGKMEEMGLVAEQTFAVKVNGNENKIKGFYGVDMEKLQGLEDKQLAGLVRNGSIALVYEHLNSLKNFSGMLPRGEASK